MEVLVHANKIAGETDGICQVLKTNFNAYPKGAKKICAILFKQMQGLSKGIILLCENNMVDEARILARSMMDVAAYLLFISEEDSEERVEWYRHSLDLSSRVAVQEFNESLTNDQEKVDMTSYLNREKEAYEYFRRKHGQVKTNDEIKSDYTLSPRSAANLLKGEARVIFKILYPKFFRPASSLTHGQNPFSFVRYEGDNLLLENKGVELKARMIINTSCILMYYSLINLNRLLDLKCDSSITSIKVNIGDLIELLKKDE